MSWFKFKSNKESINTSIKTKYTKAYYESLEYFEIGLKIFQDTSVNKSKIHTERQTQKTIAALELFDIAIEKGCDDMRAFRFRAICLRDLNYDLEAIEDLDKCIKMEPHMGSLYYDRAVTKQWIYDFEGSVADYEKAIELSKIANDDTRYWNEYAVKTGFDSATHKYELDLGFMKRDIDFSKDSFSWQDRIKRKKESLKRRFQ